MLFLVVQSMAEIPLYLCAVFLLIMGNISKGRKKLAIILASAGSILTIIVEYLLLIHYGGSSPAYRFLWTAIPLLAVLGFGILEIVLTLDLPKFERTRLLIAWAIIYLVALHRTPFWIPPLANQAESELARYIYQITYAVPLLFSVLVPMALFKDESKSPCRKWFALPGMIKESHWKPLLIGLVSYGIFFVLSNMFLLGYSIRVHLTSDFLSLARGALFVSIFWILPNHFVSFGLSKTILDRLFVGEKTSLVECLFFALLFAGFHWSYQPAFIVRKFLFGIIFAYMYLRTGTLAYGVFLDSLVQLLAP